jgi:hypothetical protein
MTTLKEIRLYFKLRPYIAQLQKEMTMKLSTNMVVQVIATAVQAANAASPMFTPKVQGSIAAVVGVLQAISACIAHFSNPDGTPATTAYKPNA